MGRVRSGTARNVGGLRELLLDDHRRRTGPGSRWHIPDAPPDKYEEALTGGLPVVISSSIIMCVLMAAGLPHANFTGRGAHGGRRWLLAPDGTLTEWTAADDVAYDAN